MVEIRNYFAECGSVSNVCSVLCMQSRSPHTLRCVWRKNRPLPVQMLMAAVCCCRFPPGVAAGRGVRVPPSHGYGGHGAHAARPVRVRQSLQLALGLLQRGLRPIVRAPAHRIPAQSSARRHCESRIASVFGVFTCSARRIGEPSVIVIKKDTYVPIIYKITSTEKDIYYRIKSSTIWTACGIIKVILFLNNFFFLSSTFINSLSQPNCIYFFA